MTYKHMHKKVPKITKKHENTLPIASVKYFSSPIVCFLCVRYILKKTYISYDNI